MKLNLRTIIQGAFLSLFVFGLFSVSYAQPTKTFFAKFDKNRTRFESPVIEMSAGKLVVNGEIRGIDVSGGSDGCYTLTVSTYRLSPSGEKILVSTISKKVCVDITRLPELVVDKILPGKYVIEVGIDRPRGFSDEKFEAKINVTYPPATTLLPR